MRTRLIAICFPLAALGCSSAPTAYTCTSPNFTAVHVSVRDSRTDTVRVFRNVTLTATDGAYITSVRRDSLVWEYFPRAEIYDTPPQYAPPGVYLTNGRPGRYDVTLNVDGYKPWTASRVVVRTAPNVCGYHVAGIDGAELDAFLVQAPTVAVPKTP